MKETGAKTEASAPAVRETDVATQTDESVLLQRARQGDYQAFEALVQGLQGRVFSIAKRIVSRQQDAEDVVQQTFLSVIEHLDSFRHESSVRTWVFRIATNHALKLLRKRRGLPMQSLDAPDASGESYATMPHPNYIAQWRGDPRTLAEDAEVRALIESALAELDEKYRLVFLLRDVEGLSIHETAEALELSEANVKVRLLRARLMLRERLTEVLGDAATRVFPDHHHE